MTDTRKKLIKDRLLPYTERTSFGQHLCLIILTPYKRGCCNFLWFPKNIFPFQAPEDGNYDDGRVRFPLMIMALEARTFKSKFADFRGNIICETS